MSAKVPSSEVAKGDACCFVLADGTRTNYELHQQMVADIDEYENMALVRESLNGQFTQDEIDFLWPFPI